MGDRDITISGKVMLFDDEYTDQDQFPCFTSRSQAILGDLVASPQGSDRDITVFVIRTKRLGLVGDYVPRDGRSYRAQFDICIVQLPKGEPLGMHKILSTPPPKVLSRISGTPGDVIGNIDDVFHWIENLPMKK